MYSELLNSTSATEAHLMIQTNTPYLSSTPRPVSSSALYMSTARVLKEGEINKPDLVTYIILFFFLFLTVTFIVFFINCQLKNSFFATLPYDRSLREARNPWRTQAVWHFSFQQEQAPETLCNKNLVPCASARMWPPLEEWAGGDGWKLCCMPIWVAVNKKLCYEKNALANLYSFLQKIAPWLQIKLCMYANVIIYPFSVHTRIIVLTTISDLGIWWSLFPHVYETKHQM